MSNLLAVNYALTNMRLQLSSVYPSVSLSLFQDVKQTQLLLEWYVTTISDSQPTVSALKVVFHLFTS